MKIFELVEFVGESKNKMLKHEQLQAVLQKKLEVKEYLGIKEKKALVNDIVNECILYEDGMYKFDESEKYICFIMKTIEAYTNLELSEDIEEDYDMLCRTKILDLIVNTFKAEYEEVNVLLSMKCDYILIGNSINAQFGKFLSNLSENIDSIVSVLSEKIGDFDISKLPISKKDLLKLMDFLNKQQ